MKISKSVEKKDILPFLDRFSLPLVSSISTALFVSSTVLHFVRRGSLAEFLLSIFVIVPIAALIRSATKDIVLKLQKNDHELLAGLVNGIFGYHSFTHLTGKTSR